MQALSNVQYRSPPSECKCTNSSSGARILRSTHSNTTHNVSYTRNNNNNNNSLPALQYYIIRGNFSKDSLYYLYFNQSTSKVCGYFAMIFNLQAIVFRPNLRAYVNIILSPLCTGFANLLLEIFQLFTKKSQKSVGCR